jgi:AcrR family transcriptional regulator
LNFNNAKINPLIESLLGKFMVERKRVSRAHGDVTRARLLEAAGRLFARGGYAGTPNKDICEAAGTDLAAISYHFGGRDGLYQAVLLEGYGQMINLERLTDIRARRCSGAEKLAAAIGMIVDGLHGERSWHGRVLAREMMAPSDHFAALVKDGVMPRFKLMAEILAEMTGFAANDPALLRCVLSVIAPILMMLVIDREMPSPFQALLMQPADELKRHLVHFAMAGLLEIKKLGTQT